MKRAILAILFFDALTLSPAGAEPAQRKPPSESTLRRCAGVLATAFPNVPLASWTLLECSTQLVSVRGKNGKAFLIDRDGRTWSLVEKDEVIK